MKIIFLDVDGVLNHSKTPDWRDGSIHVLDMECVNQLRRVLDTTGAKIVVSSTWRFSPEGMRAVLDALPKNAVIGKTPFSSRNLNAPRKLEILDWMDKVWPLTWGASFEVITHVAVIDDDNDADLEDGSFFKTKFEESGLTAEIADRMIAHLNKVS